MEDEAIAVEAETVVAEPVEEVVEAEAVLDTDVVYSKPEKDDAEAIIDLSKPEVQDAEMVEEQPKKKNLFQINLLGIERRIKMKKMN